MSAVAPPFGTPIILEPVESFALVARLHDLLDQATPKMRKAFLEMIGRARGVRTLEEIELLIRSGRLDEAVAVIELAVPGFVAAAEGVFRLAGMEVAAGAGRALGELVDFDSVNDRAVGSLQRTRARLIRELGDEQRRATLALLEGFQDLGEDPRVQARILARSIGLTERQARAVSNYRRLLIEDPEEALTRRLRDRRFDSSTRRAARGGRPLARAEVDRMVERYRERFIAHRAKTVALSETLRAVHEGEDEMLSQLVERGLVNPAAVKRTWETRRDSKVRDSHQSMQGQVRPLGTPFVSGAGYSLMYPGDAAAPASEIIRCRCGLAIYLPRLRPA